MSPACQHTELPNCTPLNVLFTDVSITLIFVGVPPLWVYNRNTEGENGDF